MSDYIKREDAIEALGEEPYVWIDDDEFAQGERSQWIEDVSAIKAVPSADRPQGEWKERETFHNADDNPIIEEWQSARCSVCNKYHTTPYMYYFSDYNFCPNCGARMKGADDE